MAAFDKDSMDIVTDKLEFGAVPADTKPITIGFDFGTSNSGVAISYKDDPHTIMCGAPTAVDAQQTKVPTALLRKEDGTWSFGNNAEREYAEALEEYATSSQTERADKEAKVHLFKGFKMVLKDKHSGMDTLSAPSIGGATHNLLDLVKISLEKLAEYALDKVRNSWATAALGRSFDPQQDVQWVITVPAIWTDFGKAFMRKAAFLAGLIAEEGSDNLMLVLEPEGASLAVHAGATDHAILQAGKKFMVLDCGGGTVDITVHMVQSIHPLKMKAVTVPSGGAWGGDFVNKNFTQFLQEFLGNHYRERQNPYGYLKINMDFDKVKMAFDPANDPTNISLREVVDDYGQLADLAASFNRKNPEKKILITPALRRGFLTMSKELMLSFFTPLLNETLKATHKLLERVPDMDYIIVVGGFGSSKVLTTSIRNEFNGVRGITVITPTQKPRPQGAIVQGSVYFGMYKSIILSRVAAYTYGAQMVINKIEDCFSKIITKGEELPIDHQYNKEFWPATDDQTQVSLRIYRSDKLNPEKVATEHFLGCVTANVPAGTKADRRCVAHLCFGGSEIKVDVTNMKGEVKKGCMSIV